MRTKSEQGRLYPRLRIDIEECTVCGDPAHASETDDEGRCVECIRAAGERPIYPDAVVAREPQWRPSDGFDATANVGAMS